MNSVKPEEFALFDKRPSFSKKQKGPARTSKQTNKLVLFPNDTDSVHPAFAHEKEFVSDTEEDLAAAINVKRATAYCTAESYNFKELHEYLCTKSENYFSPIKSDEVLYTCFSRSQMDQKSFWKSDDPEDRDMYVSKIAAMVASDLPFGEVFFFDYGVVVIWGLDEIDERRILKDLIPFEVNKLSQEDVELETLKFYHDAGHSPRLFNDIICLRSGHYMVKMTISHAIAQSVKLTIYEELVESTIDSTKDIPRMISATGKVPLPRKRITKYIGKLFEMRMNVNLVSNVLDTPEIFWYEPAFLDLYKTVRGYLEITQRADLLNQRCNVIGDLLSMLRDHINSSHAEMMEWVIFVLKW